MTFDEFQRFHEIALDGIWAATHHITINHLIAEGMSPDDAMEVADYKMLEVLLNEDCD